MNINNHSLILAPTSRFASEGEVQFKPMLASQPHYTGMKKYLEYAKLRFPERFEQAQKVTKNNLSLLEKNPNVIIEKISSFLTGNDWAGLFQLNSSLRKMKEKCLFGRSDLTNLFLQYINGDLSSLHTWDEEALKDIGPTITSLDLSKIDLSNLHIEKIVKCFPNIKELKITDATSETQLTKFLKLKNKLTSLSIIDLSDLATSSVTKVAGQFSKLRQLILGINDCRAIDLRQMLLKLANLEKLHLISDSDECVSDAINGKTMKAITNMPDLRELRINVWKITKRALAQISDCKKLKILDLSFLDIKMTQQLCDEIVKLPCLTELRINKNNVPSEQEKFLQEQKPTLQLTHPTPDEDDAFDELCKMSRSQYRTNEHDNDYSASESDNDYSAAESDDDYSTAGSDDDYATTPASPINNNE